MNPLDKGAFSLPPFPIIISNIRRGTAATLAAIALTITPSPPSTPAPTPRYHISHYRAHRRPYATAPVVVFDKDYATRIPSIWQLQTETQPQQSQQQQQQQPQQTQQRPQTIQHALPHAPSLPPPPLLSSQVRVLTRLLVALVVGGIIGMERRAANSLAGVRTFSLVSLGAAIFMSTTLLAFPKADPTRVAAAISSGVGFLGAGAMHKDSSKHSRGLTTASSVWLAAALGIAAACGMFLLSFMGAISTVLIARYARFDSSLHLIRGDPLGDLDDFGEGLRYPGENGFEVGTRGRRMDSFGSELYEVQSIVDFDPSQKGYSEWTRGNGNGSESYGSDGSHLGQNGSVDGNQQIDDRRTIE